jgi:hypothetical protein
MWLLVVWAQGTPPGQARPREQCDALLEECGDGLTKKPLLLKLMEHSGFGREQDQGVATRRIESD